MDIGVVGLGRTGGNVAERLGRAGHRVVGYDAGESARKAHAARGATAGSLDELVASLSPPRCVLLVLPPGEPTDTAIDRLASLLAAGDAVVDAGHSSWRRAAPTAERLGAAGIAFVDLGLTGGASALDEGYGLMAGGDVATVALVEPVLLDLGAEGGYAHVGPSGAGHFLKMVHNVVACGLMEAYAEAVGVLDRHPELPIDLDVADRVFAHGALTSSWNLGLVHRALIAGPDDKVVKRRDRVLGLLERFRPDRD